MQDIFQDTMTKKELNNIFNSLYILLESQSKIINSLLSNQQKSVELINRIADKVIELDNRVKELENE